MALITYNSLLDVIHARVTSAAHLRPEVLPVEVGGETVHLDLPQARAALYERPVDEVLRREVWRRAVALGQHDALASAIGSTEVTGWVEAVVWLALPHLRRVARQAAGRLGADRRDVESEVVLAVVERLAEVSVDDPDVGPDLLRAAGRRGWEFARRGAPGGRAGGAPQPRGGAPSVVVSGPPPMRVPRAGPPGPPPPGPPAARAPP
ncbi:hypothetical protein ACFV6I_10645, partial [Kitasatospora sp. NPDC059803]